MLRAASEVGGDALGFSATHLAGNIQVIFFKYFFKWQVS